MYLSSRGEDHLIFDHIKMVESIEDLIDPRDEYHFRQVTNSTAPNCPADDRIAFAVVKIWVNAA